MKENKEFDEYTNKKYLYQQQFFCQNQITFNNTIIENQIKIAKIKLDNITFDMFVYKDNDLVSNFISLNNFHEQHETKSFLMSLLYYSKKKNITKNNISMLDIGANIGWFSLILGKNGYNIISFEPSKSNYYLLLKNYCLNNEINMTIINKGLDIMDKINYLYHPINNMGNGFAISDIYHLGLKSYIKEEIKLSKLNEYIPYLIEKNLALIKLDIEGSEGKAIEGGIDLITKFHIPFIFIEFSPRLLRLKGTEPKIFLELFEHNGYKISKKDFLSKQYCSLDQLIDVVQVNLYIVYTEFLQ